MPSGVPVIIVEEPGKAPAVYEAASTVIYVLGHPPLSHRPCLSPPLGVHRISAQ